MGLVGWLVVEGDGLPWEVVALSLVLEVPGAVAGAWAACGLWVGLVMGCDGPGVVAVCGCGDVAEGLS